ncbi:MAG: 4Fe-4S dicluster domain-containing protein [Candidatus Omnitrophica bacterium]|nr:4Fe-4S dicluster domain-containing protein [Candidatus Omnitrophota bacterium]
MPLALYTISRKDLFDLLGRLAEINRVFVPYAKGDKLYFDEFDASKEDLIELGGIRQSQPLKTFLNPAREKVFNGLTRDPRPAIVVGVKACDLASLAIQDFVFEGGDVRDPFYAENRDNTTIIGCDCTYAKETCFCLAMDGAPYPRKDFDLNLSSVDNYFIVEVGGPKGEAIISGFNVFFKEPSPHARSIRESSRKAVERQVQSYIDKRGIPNTDQIRGVVKKNYDSTDFWKDMASTCVECGACNLACPTCHCFLLFDEKDRFGAKRFRIWDACLYNTFARVAGGANPRKHLYERLRNRFDKKFDFFPQVMNSFACTGCGRCVEACAGDIDIREVLKGLVSGKWNKPPHE